MVVLRQDVSEVRQSNEGTTLAEQGKSEGEWDEGGGYGLWVKAWKKPRHL